MFSESEVTPEEEENIIRKTADLILKYKMETAAILMLESIKPLVIVGGQMGRVFLYPFLAFLGDKAGEQGEKIIAVFENPSNIEKLLVTMEDKIKEEESNKEKKRESTKQQSPNKKGWRKLFSF